VRIVSLLPAATEIVCALGLLLMDGNAYLNRPGPRIVEAIETMAAWLRGDADSILDDRACRISAR
jgi:ABC-type Fe3+-hydroxamate transport system substrate-binding protein